MDLQPHPDDHEAKMARADLFKLAQYSFKLFKMIHEDMELEGWVQAKITKSADYIASVYHYMEYEMKFSEYGERLEQSDMYSSMSESQQRALTNMLTEAKATMKKLTAAQAKKLKKKNSKVEEASKPDFADLDDDGDEEEPMKKAAKDAKKVKEGSREMTGSSRDKVIRSISSKMKDTPQPQRAPKDQEEADSWARMKRDQAAIANIGNKKVKEGFPTVDDAKKRHEQEKGTGKFDKKETGDGRTQYTRKSSTFTDGGECTRLTCVLCSTFTDGGDDSDVKAAKKKAKKTDEGMMDTVKKVGKKVAGAVNKAVGHGSDEEMRKDLQRKSGAPVTGKKPAQKVKEASKPDFLDMDKDGNKKEPMKKAVADKKKNPFAKVKEAAEKCNHSAKGKSCPVHGLKECGSMAYEGRRG